MKREREKHRIIPVFMPEMACPFRCIYCNQKVITGNSSIPTSEQVVAIVDRYLSTFNEKTYTEIAFYGGTFTGLPLDIQEEMLHTVNKYVVDGRVKSIRLSTRPDYIDRNNVALLKKYGVGTIELGVQSMDDKVLSTIHRGYDVACIYKAVDIIKDASIDVGMQMMIGLPGDTMEKSVETARKIIESGAKCTRIYPTLVIKDTVLASMYESGIYHPLTLNEAIIQVKTLLLMFESAGVTILRIGLHPTEEFIRGEGFLAGPFHVSFRELVETSIWKDILEKEVASTINKMCMSEKLSENGEKYSAVVKVNPMALNYASGYNSENRKMLNNRFGKTIFIGDDTIKGRSCVIEIKPR